ncbi:DUF1003 domain-containing protein [Eupransor demetentiae]|uniref:Uncharacterized membrane protein n=1 Tax=Eupransor demetentiae TaxID=3109584 RepID=A0ABM9N458_9LACO|nr:Uncharacterized membrane protein [Lactobacillaceae bacterium LMG 33000]
MTNNQDKQFQCLVDKEMYAMTDGTFIHELDPAIRKEIKRDYPDLHKDNFICSEHLVRYRLKRMNRMIRDDLHKNELIHEKMANVSKNDNYQIIDVDKKLEETLTFGQKIADGVARFGGSWTFVLTFVGFIVGWILINGMHLFGVHFDNFPFILLNLFLSIVAAIQAPLIMMSQNRSGSYDRMESRNDYHVNLRSEEEIRLLHSKMDHLIQQDQPDVMQVQKMQMEMLASINEQLAIVMKQQKKDEE